MGLCISPITIRNKKPSVKTPRTFITVPCGKCGMCLQSRRKEWSHRLFEEYRTAEDAAFITLTYNDENVPWGEDILSLDKNHLIRTIAAINRKMYKAGLKPFRYYATGEYGTIYDRPHYHIIAFNLGKKGREMFEEIWTYGHIYWRNVGVESIEYVTKYLIDADEEYIGKEKPFSIMSKKPGLGENYITRTGKWNWNEEMKPSEAKYYCLWKGKRHKLARYYKDRLFPEAVKKLQIKLAEITIEEKKVQELERLKQFMEDPEKYLEDCSIRDNNQIRIKSLKLNRRL